MANFWRKEAHIATVPWLKNEQSIYYAWGLGSLLGCCLICHPLAAQVTPDDSLDTKTKTENNVTEITGGTTSGSNLFHSFQEFSVETGDTADFKNAAEVSNIISRVTGSNISSIDGLIRANGDANLILINPNGIALGENARLDIGGSFLGSTAESVVFADGSVFNQDINTQPLLTISSPIGLQLGQDSGAIAVSGEADLDQGVEISPGNTFALVGNGIEFDGGVVTADSGRIEIGSVKEGRVKFSEITPGWELDYAGVEQFADIKLTEESTLFNPNRTANSTGGIQVQGNQITLERSQIAGQTLADTPGGNIVINAAESLVLSGEAAIGENSSQISNNVVPGATGQGGSIEITTGKLEIQPRSYIDNSIFGEGSAGNIKISAADINIDGAGFLEFQQKYRLDVLSGDLRPGNRLTGIFAGTATSGTAGNITIETDSLNLTDGAIIFTPVYTAGHGGNINVTAKDINLSASAIQNGGGVDSVETASLGNINLTSDRLKVRDGATVINATFGDVSGGDINIVADTIDLRNALPESIIGTGLFTSTTKGTGRGGDLKVQANTINITDAVITSNSGAIFPDGTIISVGGLGGDIDIEAQAGITASGILFINSNNPELSSGAGIGTNTFTAADGGDLSIDTGKLTIRDGASLSSSTFNSGNGGQLTINAANSIELIGQPAPANQIRGGLFASSGAIALPQLISTGTSGNIKVTTPNLIVRDGALIDVQSTNEADAGNIDLVANSFLLSNQGALSAATQDGKGGNINIDGKAVKINRGLINASVLGSGTGGNIKIIAQDQVEVTGSGFERLVNNIFNPNIITPEFLASLNVNTIPEGVFAATVGTGNAGTIKFQTENLIMQDGGLIVTATAGKGAAGSIFLDAAESIVIDGSIVSNNTLSTGAGGNIAIDTGRLEILQGGRITASTLDRGNGGSITINAEDSVTVAGNINDEVSSISAGARILPNLNVKGNGGDLTINTSQLKIDDRARLAIGATGSGDGGSLEVNASDSIIIDRQASITADTPSGRGGNIKLNSENIIWRGQSSTTAASRGTGNGGNISIQATNVLALESSRLTANAFRGRGGNIKIDSNGLFICKSCQVTVSSALGIDGVVNIETLEPNSLDSLEVIPQQQTQLYEEVAVACPAKPGNTASRLTITGRGGLPNRPQEPLNARSLIEFAPKTAASTLTKPTRLPAPAQGWYRQADGKIILTAKTQGNSVNNSVINSIECHD